jgi:hypothetical protein
MSPTYTFFSRKMVEVAQELAEVTWLPLQSLSTCGHSDLLL